MNRSAPTAIVVAVILGLTLAPVPAAIGAPPTPFRFFGTRGLADALNNILLFLPLGLVLARVHGGARRPIVLAAVLSVIVEVAQIGIPGRFSSPSDILFNTLGATFGVALVRRSQLLLTPARRARRIMGVAVLAVALVVLIGGASLFRLSVPADTVLLGRRTAAYEHIPPYQGVVLEARVGDVVPRATWAHDLDVIRPLLLAGAPLHVAFTAAPVSDGVSSIFYIADNRPRAIVHLAADGTDLIFRYETLASTVGLDDPDVRVTGALAGARAGDTVTVKVWPESRGWCVAVQGSDRCGLGFTLGDTWALLLHPVPGVLDAVLPWLWLAVLFLPVGFWATAPDAFAAVVIVMATLRVGPQLAGVLPTPGGQFVAAVVGLAAGCVIGMLVRRRRVPRE